MILWLTSRTSNSGLAAHAVTLMLLATQFMGWRGVTAPQVYVGNLYICIVARLPFQPLTCLLRRYFYTGLYM